MLPKPAGDSHPVKSFPRVLQGILEIMDACGDRDASESVMDRVVGQQEARILLIYRKREVSRVPDGSLLGGRLRCRGQPFLTA
ncbi:hypothetical protein [Megasphaera sp.]|uniref:hypothetical protein n=1 Tax=Megasphaera sp. TaxID=2023260 RepID=UPI00258CD050|nr:hypothetical protein [Megasphaera sp.]